jgi:hypothetical protein
MDIFKLFRAKASRHLVSDFQIQLLKVELFRVQRAEQTYCYQLDVLERRKYDFVKVGTLKLEDVERLGQLFKQVVAYVNGPR